MRPYSLLLLVAFSLGLSACPKNSPTTKNAGNKVADDKKGPETKGAAAAVSKPGEVGFAACKAPVCMYHAGAAAYHQCLAAADGQCFHYGSTCEPTSACMYDQASKTYRSCEAKNEGTCTRFAATCQPADGCMLDPKELRYRKCSQAAGGQCQRFGALCQPNAG